MIPITNLTGRLGNQMFQFAFMYAYAKDTGMDYYFQDEIFFDRYADEIRNLFSTNIPQPLDFVAIHVRRGANPLLPSEPSYADNPFYVNLGDTDYYERAIAMFPEDKFLVFSDDMEWCKKKWGNDPRFTFHAGNEIEDMNAMAACKAQIIANSSFSWWAAWLSRNQKVIAPLAWYTDGVERTRLPNTWQRI